MKFFETLEEQSAALRSIGLAARQQARTQGVASYYIDPAKSPCIIEESPDGKIVFLKEKSVVDLIEATG